MAVKLTDFMIGIAIISALIGIFMLIVADGSVKYSSSYDNTTFSSFQNKTTQLYNMTDTVRDETSSLTSQDGFFDIVGSLFSQGFVAIKTTFASVDLFTDMASEAFGFIDIGPAGNIVLNLISLIIVILIFIGIIAAAILKWPV